MRSRLAGKVVATTRDEDALDPLLLALREEGAHVRVWPTRVFQEPEDDGPLNDALDHLDDYDWLAFTSPRAVPPAVQARSWKAGFGRVAAVGETTARALRAGGWPVHVEGEGGGAGGLARAMAAAGDIAGARVLFLAGSLASHELEGELGRLGARVERVETYRTVVTPPDGEVVRDDLSRGVSAVVFASPSAVEGLAVALDDALVPSLEGAAVVAIGPTTASALAERGVHGTRRGRRALHATGWWRMCVKALNHDREETRDGKTRRTTNE